MGKKQQFNAWTLLSLSKREMIIGLVIFIGSGLFFRWLGSIIWRKPKMVLRDRAAVIRPEINELTLQEFEGDLSHLEERVEGLNNDFLTHNKGLMENTARFRDINKVYLELRLRLNHIMNEVEKEKNEKYRGEKVGEYNKTMDKIKSELDLLNEELQRETDENQSYTLNMLTLVETIFLPLGVLTGYFGMNFSSMGGHVGKGHDPAPGILGLRYGQGFVWLIMLICTAMILYSFDWTKMEHFDIRETQKCNEARPVKPFNVASQDLRKLREEPDQPSSIFDFPHNDINFYKYE
tara:strand:- start:2313 stop:3191 length:879 start_codon:yes stop_codon:yes gene_type:complete